MDIKHRKGKEEKQVNEENERNGGGIMIIETSENTRLVGFILSQAAKALRESRGIALLYFRPLH